jgi:hypothetical protein
VTGPLRTLLAAAVLAAAPASAFPWMVKHNYGACASCHVDPSGAGQLTPYGRAQADVLVRWKVTQPPKGTEQEVPPSANFLWFLELPDWVNLSANLRGGALVVPGSAATETTLATATKVRPLIMAADLYATFNVDRFVLHGTAGYGVRVRDPVVAPLCKLDQVTQCGDSFVAREYWAGAKFADEAVMVRVGRMNLPFGLRNTEHDTWVRSLTATDTNVNQQVGASVSYNSEALRGEVMGIVGNFQISPDGYRERGYSAFGEYALAPNAYLGLSSLVTRAEFDSFNRFLGRPTVRHAHGLFVRWAPAPQVALMAEGDFLAWVATPALDRFGYAAMLQADVEPLQGLHLILIAEAAKGRLNTGTSLGAWGSVAWYPLPHLEVRLDNIVRNSGAGKPFVYNFVAQFHLFL